METIKPNIEGVSEERIDRAVQFYKEQKEGSSLGVDDTNLTQLCECSIGANPDGIRDDNFVGWTDENFKTLLDRLSQVDVDYKTKIEEISASISEIISQKPETVLQAVYLLCRYNRVDEAVTFLQEHPDQLNAFYNELKDELAENSPDDGDGGLSLKLISVMKRLL